MRDRLLAISQNSFIKGGTIFTIATFVSGFLNYLFNSLSAKMIGPANFSEIIALGSYLIMLTVPLNAITTDIVRRLGKSNRDRIQAVAGWERWMWKKIFARAFWLFPFFLLIFVTPQITNLSLPVSAALLVLTASSFPAAFYAAAYQGLHEFGAFSLVVIAIGCIKLAGPVAVWLGIGGLGSIIISITLSGIIPLLLGKYFLNRFKKGQKIIQHTPDKQIRQVLLTKSMVVTTLSLLSVTLLINIDVAFAKKFFSAHDAGLYGAWNLFAKILFYILGPVISLALIFFSNTKYRKHHTLGLLFLLTSFTLFGLIAYFFYLFFGDFAIHLIFSDEYTMIRKFLPRAAIFGLLFSMIFTINNYFLAKDSKYSLTSLIFIPIYGIVLALYGNTIESMTAIGVIATAALATSYIVAFLLHNRTISKM